MAKRTRGSRPAQSRRPGTRPTRVTGTAGEPVRAASQLGAAAEIADDVVDERRATAAEGLERVARSTPARARTRPGSLLAAKAATEYLYVSQDIRRIVLVAALLFGIMLLLWVLIVVLRVVPI